MLSASLVPYIVSSRNRAFRSATLPLPLFSAAASMSSIGASAPLCPDRISPPSLGGSVHTFSSPRMRHTSFRYALGSKDLPVRPNQE
jgi:hypothetical protein